MQSDQRVAPRTDGSISPNNKRRSGQINVLATFCGDEQVVRSHSESLDDFRLFEKSTGVRAYILGRTTNALLIAKGRNFHDQPEREDVDIPCQVSEADPPGRAQRHVSALDKRSAWFQYCVKITLFTENNASESVAVRTTRPQNVHEFQELRHDIEATRGWIQVWHREYPVLDGISHSQRSLRLRR